jgi:hypothetical protein
MAWFLFVDESGHDHRASPYEVLAGVAVEDQHLWSLVSAVHRAEEEFFGMRISSGPLELKGKKLLKHKTFTLAALMPPFETGERRRLALACLEKGQQTKGLQCGGGASRAELAALAQAKLAFVARLLELCAKHEATAFASIVEPSAPKPAGGFLRKDYAYLFERYYYFLDGCLDSPQGLVVFDELDRSRCHLLVDQMAHYFHSTAKGRQRASRIVPEPFFVHSELTTLVQLADIVAYVISWGVRFGPLGHSRREELAGLASAVCRLRYLANRKRDGQLFNVWSFAYIDDLRPREEREPDVRAQKKAMRAEPYKASMQ